MTEDALLAIVQGEITSAVGSIGSEISEERRKSLDYYLGKPLGNEVEGRSKVVMHEVKDTVEWIMPALMRIFLSGDKVVQFDPVQLEDEPASQQATEYVNHVALKQNDGFALFYQWFKDALIEKNGIVKVFWDDQKKSTKESYSDLSIDEMAMILSDPEVEVINSSQDQDLYSVTVRRTKDKGRIKIVNVPPEEFLIHRRASSIRPEGFCAHRVRKTRSDLREMGYSKKDIEGLGWDDGWNMESESRHDLDDQWPLSSLDVSTQEVWVTECYLKTDFDGDGIAELRKVTVAGDKILDNEEVDSIPFCAITPIIMPHRFFGLSIADLVMDIQLIKSTFFRNVLDNIYLSNNGRFEAVEGKVRLEDLLTTRPLSVVRVSEAGSVRRLDTPQLQPQAFTMIEYLDTIKENRTGVTRYNQGMDANSLNKMLDIYTDVPMADGSFKVLRDIVAGDIIVGGAGRPVSVIKAHEIHDPERAYRIVFASGEQIVSGGEHLWTIATETDKTAGRTRTMDTDALFHRHNRYSENIYVPRVQRPMTGVPMDLPLDPYILGVWLGDGHSWAPSVTTADRQIVDALEQWAIKNNCLLSENNHQNSGKATTYTITDSVAMSRSVMGKFNRTGKNLHRILADHGLLKGRDYNDENCKHIPEIYFQGSYPQRLELLRGLMDTDGCHHSGALCIFSQKDGRLLSDVRRLVESLGGWPSFSEVNPGELGRDGVIYLNMAFHIFDNPFRLSKKADKWRAPLRNVATQPIISIVPTEIRPMRCLTVDAPDGLFCVGRRWTVTHNTMGGITQIMTAAQQRIELIARTFAETGVKDLFRKIYEQVCKHEKRSRVVRLRNEWVPIDPTSWSTEMDLTVSVGIGTGNKDQMLMHLDKIMAYQAEILKMQGGPTGPLVGYDEIHTALSKVIENAGLKASGLYFKPPPQGGYQPPEAPIPPDVQKAQIESQAKQQQLQGQVQVDLAKEERLAAQNAMQIQAKAELSRFQAELREETARQIARINADCQNDDDYRMKMQQHEQMIAQNGQMMMDGLNAILQRMHNRKPSVVVRDESGKAVGIEGDNPGVIAYDEAGRIAGITPVETVE